MAIKKTGTPVKKRTSPPIKASDTTHVKTTGGYKIVVKKGSPYDKQAKKLGTVINQHRPGNTKSTTKENDPLAVKNYNKRYTKK